MQVDIAVVMSVDGKLTRHDETDLKAWASKEDQKFFYSLLATYDSVVMGPGTYEAFKHNFVMDSQRLRIVLTSHPDKYADVSIPGKLDFRNQSPAELVKGLESENFKKLMVLGGPRMISDFLSEGLINKIYVTLEPRLFGTGKPLLADLPVDMHLQLVKSEQLNTEGTLLLTYQVS